MIDAVHPYRADQDEIDRDSIVQQPRHEPSRNARAAVAAIAKSWQRQWARRVIGERADALCARDTRRLLSDTSQCRAKGPEYLAPSQTRRPGNTKVAGGWAE